ncbi:MAG: esterase-like activity of phytase family protein [Alphaproteobacteria bacterium]
MKRLILAALLGLAACGDGREAGEVDIRANAVALYPNADEHRQLGSLVYRGGLVLSSDDPRFGGLSALEVSEDGSRMLAVSDSGYWLTASLEFDGGQLTGVSEARMADMLDAAGRKWLGDHEDAEGLAPLGDGRYAVSFERDHRVLAYDIGVDWSGIDTALPTPLPAPPGVERLRGNGGIEGMGPGENGVIWMAVEDPIIDGRPHTIWQIHTGGGIDQSYNVAVPRGFGLTSIAAEADGTLIVIERYYSPDVGNRVRVVRITPEALEAGRMAGSVIEPDLLAEFTPDMTVDNLEGAALATVNGETRLFLISDDNYNPSQRTLLLSFVIPR